MSHSLTLFARCKVNHKLYKVGLSEQSAQGFTLRPVDSLNPQYKYIHATTAQLRNRELFTLYPLMKCQAEPTPIAIETPAMVQA